MFNKKLKKRIKKLEKKLEYQEKWNNEMYRFIKEKIEAFGKLKNE